MADLIDFNMGVTNTPISGMTEQNLENWIVFWCVWISLRFFLKSDGPSRELSNHCPITLLSNVIDSGPPPFRFFNTWLMKDGLDKVVKKTWGEFRGFGTTDLFLGAKLRYVKEAIKKWNKEIASKADLEASQPRKTIQFGLNGRI